MPKTENKGPRNNNSKKAVWTTVPVQFLNIATSSNQRRLVCRAAFGCFSCHVFLLWATFPMTIHIVSTQKQYGIQNFIAQRFKHILAEH
jgi:hypothetical protein